MSRLGGSGQLTNRWIVETSFHSRDRKENDIREEMIRYVVEHLQSVRTIAKDSIGEGDRKMF